MPRAHCLDCGDNVVIDPAGRCAEGHEVGAPGARIEGSLGSAVPHPDEPEPWVARVELDVAVTPPPVEQVREIRPPAAPSAPATSPAPAPRPEELLRELHSLGDLGSPPPAPPTVGSVQPPPASTTPPPAPPAPPVATGSPAPSDRSSFDELGALEAAVQALSATNGSRSVGSVNGTNPEHTPTSTAGAAPSLPPAGTEGTDLRTLAPPTAPEPSPTISAQLDDLFAAADLSAGTTPPPPSPQQQPTPPAAEVAEVAGEPGGPERWSVLADVAEIAERHSETTPATAPTSSVPPAPGTPPVDEVAAAEAPAPPAQAGIDLGNFTASGKRVGNGSKGKRRLFGR